MISKISNFKVATIILFLSGIACSFGTSNQITPSSLGPLQTQTHSVSLTQTQSSIVVVTQTPLVKTQKGIPDELTEILPTNAEQLKDIYHFGRGNPNDISWCPNQKILAVATDKGIDLYDPVTNELKYQLLSDMDIKSIDCSPDGKLLASASSDDANHKIILWNTNDWKQYTVLNNPYSVDMVIFSPTKNILASVSGDEITLWDISNNAMLYKLVGHKGNVKTIAFSPDGNILASASAYKEDDNSIRLWDIHTGLEIHNFGVGSYNGLGNILFSPDSKYLISPDHTWNVQTFDTVDLYSKESPYSDIDYSALAISPDNRLEATAYEGSPRIALSYIKSNKGTSDGLVGDQSYTVRILKFSPDSSMLASLGDTVHIWKLNVKPFEIISLSNSLSPKSVIASVAMDTLLFSEGRLIHGFHLSDISGILPVEVPDDKRNGHAVFLKFSLDGKYLVSQGNDLNIWSLPEYTLLATIPAVGNDFPSDVVFSPDNKMIAYRIGQNVIVWDISSDKRFAQFVVHEDTGQPYSFTPDGKNLIFSDFLANIEIWNIKDRVKVSGFNFTDGDTQDGRSEVSPNGHILAVIKDPTKLRIWDLATGQKLKELNAYKSEVIVSDELGTASLKNWITSLVFSPDGKLLVSIDAANDLIMWDVATGKRLYEFKGFTGYQPYYANFSIDQKLLIIFNENSISLFGVK